MSDLIVTSSSGVLTSDVPCRACGYNLRGLAAGGLCPECAHPIERSIEEHVTQHATGFRPLHLAPDAWLTTQCRATALLISSAALHVLCVALSFFTLPLPISRAMYVVAAAPMAVGLWMLGTPEAGRRADSLWRIVRVSAVVYAASMTAVFLFVVLGAWQNWPWIFPIHRYAVSFVTLVCLLHLARLAGRAGRPRLFHDALGLAILIPATNIAQNHFLGSFELRPNHIWIMLPEPMTGQLNTLALIPVSTYLWPRINWPYVAWLLLGGLSFAAVVVEVFVLVTLLTARRTGRAPSGDTSPPA